MGDYSGEVNKPTILVTGFMPFGNHAINASWVAVQELDKMGLNDDLNLVVMEMPVEYDAVKNIVPGLWKKYQPKLVVHVGVSGIAKELTLEQQAFNDGYFRPDTSGQCPGTHCCIEGGAKNIVSCIDMQSVCADVNDSRCGVDAVVSADAGRYLCDFIYYTSLNIDSSCAAFIHVPPLGKPYTAVELATALRLAILSMVAQLHIR